MKQFREIGDFPGYYVADDGSAATLDGDRLKPIAVRMKSNGRAGGRRAYVTLWRDGKRHDVRIATLILTAFVGPRPA